MKTFQNKQDGFKSIQGKVLMITIPLMSFAMLIGIAPGLANPDTNQLVLPILILILVGVMGFGLAKGLNRQRKIFKSYRLTIDDDFIQREAWNTPTVKIAKSDVTEIIQGKNGNMLIRGRQQTDFIAISVLINNLDELRAELNQIKEIKILRKTPSTAKVSYLMVGGVLITMAIVYLSTNKILVVGSSAILTASLIWSFYEVQTSKNVDFKTKRASWWTILVIVSVLAITYGKLRH